MMMPELIDPNHKTNIPEPLMFGRCMRSKMDYVLHMENMTDVDAYLTNKIFKKHENMIMKLSESIVMTTNKYEYNKPKNMKQFVIWTLNNNTTHDQIMMLLEKNNFLKNKQFLLWTNYNTSYSSVKSIKHFHLMTRNIVPTSYLKKVIIIARHGPREPITIVPKLGKWDSDEAMLTEKGKSYCYNFGYVMRNHYGPYINILPENTVAYSSNTERTITSAKYFIKGLVDVENFDVHINNILFGDYDMTMVQQNELTEWIRKINIRDSDLDKNINQILGYDVTMSSDYYDVFSTLKCYEYDGRKIPDAWTPQLMKKIEHKATQYYNELYTHYENVQIKKIIQYIDSILLGSEKNFVYMSTHDSNVFPLGLYIYKDLLKIPDFCSNVRYEIWNNMTRIYYDDLLIHEEFRFNDSDFVNTGLNE